MNLIKDAWISAIRAKSGRCMIAPWQIAEQEDPVMELAAPRPDFQGAMYQFLIGLLQTGFAPEDQDEWLDYWDNPPEPAVLKERLESLAAAFEFDNPGGAAFLQDLKLLNEKKKEENIAALLIDSPGSSTEKENLDHFVKRGKVTHACHACAAMAIFTLQTNAPSGGNGHRVSVRGGGPLTTLILPPENGTLWQTLWLNVLDAEDIPTGNVSADVFPWMAATRVSDQKKVNGEKIYILNGVPTMPSDTHPLQMYWGMPRRIRIQFDSSNSGSCDLCGTFDSKLISKYYTGVWGTDYVGNWIHPLTPYYFDPKKQKPPLSIKGQQGGLGYQHWLSLTLADDENGEAAKVVRRYTDKRAAALKLQRTARLWCFGYDMDSMKARCWYDHTFPLFNLAPRQRANLLAWTTELINLANDVSGILKKQVKAAWFKSPENFKSDKGELNSVELDFWQRTEPTFFNLLQQLSEIAAQQDTPPPELYSRWKKVMQSVPLDIFDTWVAEAQTEDTDMLRIIRERLGLGRQIGGCKAMKIVKAKALPEEKEEANGAKA